MDCPLARLRSPPACSPRAAAPVGDGDAEHPGIIDQCRGISVSSHAAIVARGPAPGAAVLGAEPGANRAPTCATRASLRSDVALAEIESNSGKLYDPDVAAAVLKLFRERGFQFKVN